MRDFIVTLLVVASCVPLVAASDLDEFNYDQTLGNSFGPSDWDQVGCSDPHTCRGWPDAWEMAIDWELDQNDCRWCPADDDGLCDIHHQSPINLERNRALENHPMYNECIDIHWMAYHDSSCDFDTLKQEKAFSIERHALKIVQPIEPTGVNDNEYRLACEAPTGARTWGKIDFSRGFSHWWHLSHIDFHVPSEHTQEGKQYSGEIQMYHWYSVNASIAGIHNEMAAVSIFLEEFDKVPDNNVLNRIICQWREAEEETREACGLASVTTHYPGCYFYTRAAGARRLHSQNSDEHSFRSVADLIINNQRNPASPTTVVVERDEDSNMELTFDWDAFITSYSESTNPPRPGERHLMDYDHVIPWFNYFPMLDVKTEYYYRYSGTQTVPPCYGKWFSGNDRRQTNHWRIMKDPIRVSRRQIDEMHRLLRERIAPVNDPVRPCMPDTAAKKFSNSTRVSVARPIQSTRGVHFKVFCECDDWTSKWPEDQKWCEMEKLDRFYRHPYNFDTTTF